MRTRLVLVGLLIAACSSGPDAGQPDGGTDGGADATTDAAPSTLLSFSTPMNGDLAEPGDNVDITVSATVAGAQLTLLVDDVETAVTWTPDPNDATIQHAPFTIPSSASGPLRFDVIAADAMPASAQMQIVAPAAKATAIASATADTVVTLSSGAKLTVPAGVLPDGATVELASYPGVTIPWFASLVSPIYRVHVSANETLINGSMWLDQPLSAQDVSTYANVASTVSLDFYEGDEPDSEGGPMQVRPQVAVATDGTGTAHVEVPGRAFHHTGSSGAIMGLENAPYPFQIGSPQICASDDTDGNPPACQPLQRTYGAANTPNVTLPCPSSNPSPHVNVTASIQWTDTPPAFVTPLDDAASNGATPSPPYAKDILNPLRKHPTKPVWRYHEGADLRAQTPFPLHAAIAGRARAHMQNEYTLDINVGKWWVRNMHVSDFVGFVQPFSANAVLGQTLVTVNGKKKFIDVKAPADGTYELSCRESPANAPQAILICTVRRTDDPAPHWQKDLYRLPEDVWARDVTAGEVVAMTGHTGSFAVPYHLHFEVWYGRIHGVHIDPAFFYDTISRSSLDNGDPSILQTPTLRIDALLAQRNKPNVFLGIDPTTLVDQSANNQPMACPYGGTLSKYGIVKVHGPTATPTTIDWDLGPCIAQSVCSQTNATDVRVSLGTTTWRRANANEYPNSPGGWNVLVNGGQYTSPPPLVLGQGGDVDEMTAWVLQPNSSPKPSDFEGMTVTVQGITGEFATSTITVTNVTLVGPPSSYVGSFNGPEAGNPSPLSTTLPTTATVLTFGDKVQPACVVGFPTTFTSTNTANRCGRSNLIAYWYDTVAKQWRWAWNISGGSYNSGGGFPQWHEYQFLYDASKATHYDVFLGPNAAPPSTSSGWNFNRTAALSVTVAFAKQLGYTLN